MKVSILSLALTVTRVWAGTYNILALDSASYFGLMTSEFISYLEKKAYLIARREFCIDERA